MKLFISTIVFFVALSTNVFAATEAQSFVGRWEVSAKEFGQSAPNNQRNEGRLIIELQNGQYKGTFNRLTFTGKLQADGLHLVYSGQSGSCGELVLTIANGMIAGKGTVAQTPVTITGQRPAMRPYNAPKLYTFEPKAFYPWFSNTIPPALHIFPGDSVRTTTVDAKGYDEHSAPRSPSGNPETGPFYVEGAMPGDTLVVHLNRIRLNRTTAFQNNSIAPNALDPNYLRNMPKDPSTTVVFFV